MGTSASLQNKSQNVCKLCATKTSNSCQCLDCDILMCTKCKERKHPKLQNATSHKVILLKDIRQKSEDVDLKSFKCHPGSGYVKYCTVCDQLVCHQCIANIHGNHILDEVTHEYVRKISQLRNWMDPEVPSEEEAIINFLKKDETAKYDKVKNLIMLQNIFLKNKIDEYTNKLLADLREKWNTLVDTVNEAEKRVILTRINEAEKIEQIINSNNVEQIFKESKRIGNSLKEPLQAISISCPIFEPGKIQESNIGTLAEISLQAVQPYTTDTIALGFVEPCVDALWISDQKVLQKVQPEADTLKVLATHSDIHVAGIAVTPSNDVLVCVSESVVKTIGKDGRLKDSKYSVYPFEATVVHVTRNWEVLVGAVAIFGNSLQPIRQEILILFDKEGKNKTILGDNGNYKSIFVTIERITATQDGNICVLDTLLNKGRVVVLDKEGSVLNIYFGHPDINTESEPFFPASIVTTPLNRILAPDRDTGVVHVLNNIGQLLTHIVTLYIGIRTSLSVAFTVTGKVFIGATGRKNGKCAKLFEIKLSEC